MAPRVEDVYGKDVVMNIARENKMTVVSSTGSELVNITNDLAGYEFMLQVFDGSTKVRD